MDIGAMYYNCYYPGPIGLPPNAAFDLHIDGRYVLLHLVRHLRPVVITDRSPIRGGRRSDDVNIRRSQHCTSAGEPG